MEFLRKCSAILSPALVALMVYTAAPILPAFAGIVTTDRLIDLQAADADRHNVSKFLAREDVRDQMIQLGFDPADVDQRIAALSDTETRALADHIDQMPAGQGVSGLLIFVAAVLFVVFLITDTAGITNAQSDENL